MCVLLMILVIISPVSKEYTRVLFCNKDCITPLESKGDVKQ